jgi:ketosteroid isomerase-like protein/TolB-like protein
MSDVVLARSACDDAKAVALLRVLRSAGIDVDLVDAADPEAAHDAHCIVVAWSACSVEIPWMRRLARAGARREALVPVLFDDVIPPVRGGVPVDLRDWTGARRHPALATLQAAVAVSAAAPRPAARAPEPAAPEPATPADDAEMMSAATGVAEAVGAAIEVAPKLLSRRSRIYRRVATVAGGLALVGQILSSGIDVMDTLPTSPPKDPGRLVVGVMNVAAEGAAPPWAAALTRDRLNAILNRFGAIEVMSKQQIAFVQRRDRVTAIEAARRLGIERMISGTISVVGGRWKLMVEVVDPARGTLTQTEEEEGVEDALPGMQNRLAAKLIRGLGVKFDGREIDELVRLAPMAEPDDFRRLMESMGDFADEPAPPADDHSRWWRLLGPAVAHAETSDETAIRALLEEYRDALEAEDMARLDRIHAGDNPRLRDALVRYLANAEALDVELSDVVVAVDGDTALATFTRRDAFRDAATGRDVHMELRVSNALVRRDGSWLILGAKR